MKPPRSRRPNSRWAKASVWRCERYRYFGPGVRLNGFSANPSCSSYTCCIPGADDVRAGATQRLHLRSRGGASEHGWGHLAGEAVVSEAAQEVDHVFLGGAVEDDQLRQGVAGRLEGPRQVGREDALDVAAP